jgi:hypothetical protein
MDEKFRRAMTKQQRSGSSKEYKDDAYLCHTLPLPSLSPQKNFFCFGRGEAKEQARFLRGPARQCKNYKTNSWGKLEA